VLGIWKLQRRPTGAVLLLALLVMSSMLLTGATLGTISVFSLRQGRVIDDSIVAFGAAESAAEQSLYQLRRVGTGTVALGTTNPNHDSSPVFSGPPMTNGSTWKRSLANGEQTLTVSIPKDRSYEVVLWDPENIAAPALVESMKFVWSDACGGSSGLEVLAVGWDPTVSGPPLAADVSFHGNSPALTFLRDPSGVVDNSFVSGRAYRVKLRAKTCDIYSLAITAHSSDNAVGSVILPTRTAVTATGSFGSARQAVELRLPRLQPLTGIFDFVIFAQCSILKGVTGPACP
jgi:hypothetical protein